MERDAVVILGNPLMGDEGVAVRVLERLRKENRLPSSVDLIDTAGSLLTAFHALSGHRKVLFVDCAFMGEKPGASRRFRPDETRSIKPLSGFSAHEGDLMGLLRTAPALGAEAEVLVYGIEPEYVGPRLGLSQTLEARLDSYTDDILGEFTGRDPS